LIELICLEVSVISEFAKSFDLEAHFAGCEAEIVKWSSKFQELGFVSMDNFIPEQLRYLIELEVANCLAETAKRRDAKVSSTDNQRRLLQVSEPVLSRIPPECPASLNSRYSS